MTSEALIYPTYNVGLYQAVIMITDRFTSSARHCTEFCQLSRMLYSLQLCENKSEAIALNRIFSATGHTISLYI